MKQIKIQLRIASERSRYSNSTVTLLEQSASLVRYSIKAFSYATNHCVESSAMQQVTQ